MKTKTIIAIGFVLALLAGASLGVLGDRTLPLQDRDERPDRGGRHGERDRRASLAQELDLTSQQREQMDAIWSGLLKEHGRGGPDRFRAIQKERDEAIVALLNDEQKKEYDRIQADHTGKMDELARQREEAYADAVRRTKDILNEQQRATYEEILKRRRGPGGPHGPRTRPTTAAAQ
jgi:hypothetical protein